jgi:site-specific recombinase XerD
LYLKTEKNCGNNTTTKFLQNFKRIITIALRSGWIVQDPFVHINMSIEEVERPYLTQEELNRLLNIHSPFDRINRVRDFFVFSCFTGLAYIDIKQLTRKEIEENENCMWIRTHRQKTGVRSNVPLLDIPKSIINKYTVLEALNPNDKLLPIISNQKMNAYLKELADLCKIGKDLTFHVARHTFATTVTMTNGVPIESVSKMLGHKKIATTQHYARIVDRKVGEDMNILANKLTYQFTPNR